MKAQWVLAPDPLKYAKRRAPISEIILRMGFHPGDRRRCVQDLAKVLCPESDPGLCRDRGGIVKSHRVLAYIFFMLISFIFARSSFVIASTVPLAIFPHSPFGKKT